LKPHLTSSVLFCSVLTVRGPIRQSKPTMDGQSYVAIAIVLVTLASLTCSANIEAIDSDFMFLKIKTTTLPLPAGSSSLGVFATADIPENELICEHRGAVIPADIEYESDYIFGTVDSQGNGINIIPQFSELGSTNMPICSYINDCVKILGETFSSEDVSAIENGTKAFTLYPGTTYNVRPLVTKMGKVVVVSSRKITAGTELFYEYGNKYWTYRLRRPEQYSFVTLVD